MKNLKKKTRKRVAKKATRKPARKAQETIDTAEARQVLVKFKGDGVVHFENQLELANAARLLMKMKMVPNHLMAEGLEGVMSALTLLAQFSLPYSALNETAYIEGQLGFFGHLMMTIAQRDPLFWKFRFRFVDKEYNVISRANKNLHVRPWACCIYVMKKDREFYQEYFYTVDEAIEAGIPEKEGTIFHTYRKDYLYHKAKNRALNIEFGGVLKGVMSAELLILEREARMEKGSTVAQFNEMFGLGKDKK